MHIVWFSWKDNNHPLAGGAEVVSSEIRKRLLKDGHTVTLITARYNGSTETDTVDGVNIIRRGGRFSVYWSARSVYKSLDETADLVVDEMNTIPFFAATYTKNVPKILLTYQLARSVWFYQMIFPFSILGYLLEPIYLRFLSNKYNLILTESESTKKDLQKYGFKDSTIKVFPIGIEIQPKQSLKNMNFSNEILFLGALRPMKRPLDAIKAFEIARDTNNKLRLIIAGSTDGKYAKKVIKYAESSCHSEAINIKGRVSKSEKIILLGRADVILVTSIKEGWGLIATEANSQGTPAIAYDTDGLRDSVVHNQTGLLVKSGDFQAMGQAINKVYSNEKNFQRLSINSLKSSKQYTFDNSYNQFLDHIKKHII